MVTALTAVAAVVVAAYWATAPPAMVAAVWWFVVAYWATAIQTRAGPYLAGTFTPAARFRAVAGNLGVFKGPSRAPP